MLVGLIALCVYVATAGGSLSSSDGVMTYEVTKSIVTEGSVAASFDVFSWEPHRGVDGRFYSPFGIGQSIFNIPFYLVGRTARQVLGITLGKPDSIEKAAVAMSSAVAAAGAVWVVFLFAFRISGQIGAATLTALTLAFATLLWPYAKFGFNAPLTAWCLTGGAYATWLGLRTEGNWEIEKSGNREIGTAPNFPITRLPNYQILWGGLWFACAFLTRHEMALAGVAALVWVNFESRGRPRVLLQRLAWLGTPLAVALGLWLWHNAARFGDPLNTGNAGDPVIRFDSPILAGMYGLLLSPGRSLFIYTPIAIAGLASLSELIRRDRSLTWFITALLGTFLILYAALPNWEGSRGYGPRYLVPLVPLMVLPLACLYATARRWRRTVLLGLTGLSVAVQIPGVLVDFSKVSVAYGREMGVYDRQARLYTWPASGLALNIRAASVAVPENARYLLRGERPAVSQDAPTDDRDFSQQFAFSLDFWWLYLYYLGAISALVALAAGALPLAVAAALARTIVAEVRS